MSNVRPLKPTSMQTAAEVEAKVSLQEISASTVRQITDLSVKPEQANYVASNAVSIAQAYFHREAWFRAIYAGTSPVGFVMLRDGTLLLSEPPSRELSLWRFMVDHRFQKLGYGRKALKLVVTHARALPQAESIQTSYVPGPHGPRDFYLSFGFRHTGKTRPNGEVCLSFQF